MVLTKHENNVKDKVTYTTEIPGAETNKYYFASRLHSNKNIKIICKKTKQMILNQNRSSPIF